MVPFYIAKRFATLISREVEVKAVHIPFYFSSNFLPTPLYKVIPSYIIKAGLDFILLKHTVRVFLRPSNL